MADRNKMKELRMKKLQEGQNNLTSKTVAETLDVDTPLSSLVNNLISDEKSKQVFLADADTFISYPDEKIRLKLHDGDKKEALKESIQQDGILEPVLVWMENGKKVVLAGHNRINIAKELGIKVPYIVMEEVDQKRADRIVVITNLQNRQYSEMLPSELSNMLSRLITSYDDSVYKEDVYKDIDKEFSLSKRKIIQYLRLQKLINEFMQMLDDNKISLYVAYQLSGVSVEKQQNLFDFITLNQISTITMKQIDRLLERTKTSWDNSFFMEVFSLITPVKKKVQKKNITLETSKVTSFLLENEKENTAKSIMNILSYRAKLIKKIEDASIEYSEDLVMNIIDDYISKI